VPTAFSTALFLEKFVPRSLLATAASKMMAVKGDSRRFAVDDRGNWINSQPEGSFVGPDLHTAHYAQVKATIAHYWFEEYTPVEGDVVIDVGAGIGEDAVILSHLVGNGGRVHAIEAHPGTYACLEATLRLSSLDNVDPHMLAITETNGSVTISDSANHLANSIMSEGNGLKVEAQSLDEFIRQSGHKTIDFLKMNIEGAERGAMLGLDREAANVRHVAISCHDFIADLGGGDQFRTKKDVRQRLVQLGYVVTQRNDAKTPWEADVLFGRRD
jgi:FkbM family methyltransferase